MIWHFFEVWVLMLAAFAIGCPIGAVAYKLIAESPLADLQGDFADRVGDLVDGIKSRLGIGPVWRPEYRRLVERAARGAEDLDSYDRPRIEGSVRQDRLLGAGPAPRSVERLEHLVMDGADDAEADGAASAVSGEPGETAENEETTMARPMALVAPRNSVPDDLQRIRGIGRRIERRLNALGIFHFGQIAAWTPAEMRWMAQQLAFPDRIERDDWIGQAIILAAGGETGFVKSADRRRAQRRQKALERAIERSADADDTAEFEAGKVMDETAPTEAAFFGGDEVSDVDPVARDDAPAPAAETFEEADAAAQPAERAEGDEIQEALEALAGEEGTDTAGAEAHVGATEHPEGMEPSEGGEPSEGTESSEKDEAPEESVVPRDGDAPNTGS